MYMCGRLGAVIPLPLDDSQTKSRALGIFLQNRAFKSMYDNLYINTSVFQTSGAFS